ncbi:carbohydrate-binding protein [Cystobacter fuscus]|uniref:polysaccharide lyase n=1 Tax=Cystobacter fuscus TaxID=43 RepID=UPI002B2BA9F7|nr:carbohydrate-binding protein [Cystobacter fuscus]
MRRLLLALFAVLMPGLSWAGVVWRGDFETGGITQYTRAQRVSADRLQIVQSPAFQGRYALKATVRQGDDPIDSSGNRNELVYMGQEKEGSEYYYRWQVMFPTDYPSVDAWQVFTQWHHSGCCGSPPVEFFVKGEEMRLTLADSATPWKTKLVRGVWQDFIFHVKWSSDASVGFVELWLNGQRVLSKYKYATLYEGDGVYLKLGLYRSDTVKPVGVVYHDGYTQATQLADVLPPPEPPPPPVDAGTPAPVDAGTPAPTDAGSPGPVDAGTPGAGPGTEVPPAGDTPVDSSSPMPGTGSVLPPLGDQAHAGGCSSTGGALGVLALLGLVGLPRRWRRR